MRSASLNPKRWFAKTIWFICFNIATFPIFGWAAESLSGQVLRVADGDTITIITDAEQTRKIRLSEIDTPERDQPWGRQASRALSKKVANKSIVAKVSGVDRYDIVLTGPQPLEAEAANKKPSVTISPIKRASVAREYTAYGILRPRQILSLASQVDGEVNWVCSKHSS